MPMYCSRRRGPNLLPLVSRPGGVGWTRLVLPTDFQEGHHVNARRGSGHPCGSADAGPDVFSTEARDKYYVGHSDPLPTRCTVH